MYIYIYIYIIQQMHDTKIWLAVRKDDKDLVAVQILFTSIIQGSHPMAFILSTTSINTLTASQSHTVWVGPQIRTTT